MFSFDLARCSGVLPARSKASTLAPARRTSKSESEVCLQDLVSLGSINRDRAGKGQAVIAIEEALPPRSSVVMTGTWFVQAAGEGKHRTHNSEVLANNKGVSAYAWSLLLPKGLFAMGSSPTAKGNLTLKPEYSLWNRSRNPWGWQREGN